MVETVGHALLAPPRVYARAGVCRERAQDPRDLVCDAEGAGEERHLLGHGPGHAHVGAQEPPVAPGASGRGGERVSSTFKVVGETLVAKGALWNNQPEAQLPRLQRLQPYTSPLLKKSKSG